MNVFEIIITKNEISAEDWLNLVNTLSKHIKGIKPFSVVVKFKENIIQFLLVSKSDLSQLSSGIDGIIIAKAHEDDQQYANKPECSNKIRFLRIPTGGNILDLKERYSVQDSMDLKFVYIDIQHIGNKLISKMHSYFFVGKTPRVARQQLALFPAHLLTIDFSKNSTYLKKSSPKYLSIEKTLHIMSSDGSNAIFSVDTFPYLSQSYYINLSSYEFDRHSFIIGASGSGKSKLIGLLIDRMSRINMGVNYRVVVIDPHAAIAEDLEHINNSRIINFSGESAQLFPDSAADISASTELTTTLFKSLVADQYNPRLERVLRFSLYVLFVAQSMSMQMLKTFLTDIDTRNQILEHVKGYVPVNIQTFFGSDYNEIRTQHYNEAVLPLVSLVDEMQLQPTLVGESEQSLAKTIQDNFLTVFSLNKVSMGEKVVKTVAGLLIQQIFLLAQARVFDQKIILIIDEVSVIQNPALAQILAEARKFNLTVILTQQYFGQIEKDLRDSILSNVFNYYVFKVSEEDARALEGNLEIDVPTEIMQEAKEKGIKESEVRAKIMVELDPRECLVRLSSGGQLLPSILARTVDAPVRKLQASNGDIELKPYQQAKLPPKFDITADRASTIPSVVVGRASAKENLISDTEYDPKMGGKFVIAATMRSEESYGRSFKDLLIKQSSSRKKLK